MIEKIKTYLETIKAYFKAYGLGVIGSIVIFIILLLPTPKKQINTGNVGIPPISHSSSDPYKVLEQIPKPYQGRMYEKQVSIELIEKNQRQLDLRIADLEKALSNWDYSEAIKLYEKTYWDDTRLSKYQTNALKRDLERRIAELEFRMITETPPAIKRLGDGLIEIAKQKAKETVYNDFPYAKPTAINSELMCTPTVRQINRILYFRYKVIVETIMQPGNNQKDYILIIECEVPPSFDSVDYYTHVISKVLKAD